MLLCCTQGFPLILKMYYKMAAYLWRYVTINLFWFLDLLRLPLHRRVMLILLFSHRRPPLRS